MQIKCRLEIHYKNILKTSYYEGDSINYVTNALCIKTTNAIFMNDTSLKRSYSCGYSGILLNDNHTFLRPANFTTMSISYRHCPYLLIKYIKFSYGLA